MPYIAIPKGWPDDLAKWVWDRSSIGIGVPAGTAYFRKTFTGGAVDVEVWAAADDEYELYIDGTVVLADGMDAGYQGEPLSTVVTLTAGEHVIAAKVTNHDNFRAGLLVSVRELDEAGTPISVIVRSDATWKMLAYPTSPPGFTPGQVIRLLVEEAQARGALAGLTLGFTDLVDSEGSAWPVAAEITVDLGADLLSALRQLGETYLDIAMAPGAFTLNAWLDRGATTPVVLAPGVNLTALRHDGTV